MLLKIFNNLIKSQKDLMKDVKILALRYWIKYNETN